MRQATVVANSKFNLWQALNIPTSTVEISMVQVLGIKVIAHIFKEQLQCKQQVIQNTRRAFNANKNA